MESAFVLQMNGMFQENSVTVMTETATSTMDSPVQVQYCPTLIALCQVTDTHTVPDRTDSRNKGHLLKWSSYVGASRNKH